MRRFLPALVIVCILAGGFIPAAAKAEGSLGDIQQRLTKSDMLRAGFLQEKHLRALSRPLVSRGELTFVAGEGVLWRVLEPFVMTVLLAPEEIIEWDGDGEMRRVNTGANPMFQALGDVFLAILSGDTALLEKHFELSPGTSNARWRLLLRPKSEPLGAVIAHVQVIGDRFVEEVEINEKKGDSTTLQFSDFTLGPFELNEIERNHFAR